MKPKNYLPGLIAILVVFKFTLGVCQAQNWTLDRELQTRVDEAVEIEIAKQEIVGAAIGLIQDGEIVYCAGYGHADREANVPFSTATITNWASNSKPLIAAAALQLVERQELVLDAPIRHYLPELPLSYATITVRHLLSHQSGYPHYSNGTIKSMPAASRLSNDLQDPLHSLGRFANSPLISEPGTTCSYSSYGYIILSAVVQRAGRQPIMEQLRERLVIPSGMKTFQLDNTFYNQRHWATGYDKTGGGMIEAIPDTAHYWKHGAGAYKSDIVDFARWARAFMNGSLLSTSSRKAMWTPQKTNSGEKTRMGLGISVELQNGILKLSHDGSHREARSRMVLYPALKSGVVVFANCGYAEPSRLSTAVYRALKN